MVQADTLACKPKYTHTRTYTSCPFVPLLWWFLLLWQLLCNGTLSLTTSSFWCSLAYWEVAWQHAVAPFLPSPPPFYLPLLISLHLYLAIWSPRWFPITNGLNEAFPHQFKDCFVQWKADRSSLVSLILICSLFEWLKAVFLLKSIHFPFHLLKLNRHSLRVLSSVFHRGLRIGMSGTRIQSCWKIILSTG